MNVSPSPPPPSSSPSASRTASPLRTKRMFGFSGSLLLPGTNGVLGGGSEREREKEKPTVQWIPASPHSPLKSPLRHSRSPSVTRPTSPDSLVHFRQDWDVPEQKLGSPVSLVPSTGKPVRPFSDYVDQFNIFPDPALYEDAPISEAAKPTVFSPAPRSITPRLGLRVFNSNTSLNGGGSNTAASISSVGRDAGQLIARKLTWIKDFFFRQQPSAAPIQEFGIPRSSSAPPNPQESLTVSPPSVPSLALDTTAKQFDHEDTTHNLPQFLNDPYTHHLLLKLLHQSLLQGLAQESHPRPQPNSGPSLVSHQDPMSSKPVTNCCPPLHPQTSSQPSQ
ncbi:hypothetical protein BCR33DRAFT_733520 [Rhizoclosmatium globosum]|uniref:Uncharacterized protein n=1 Tax=Rhizoclosmatium globosum TaxID=329046 RepID=A0A1Y2CY98_9FUNG|nr:hypothetical protein BCR33DRAFT_733520 [Rhizoclosmatium globosum]|eukprot:ORY51990.1 hypothetical protein BCR33DRAFT_733520 [Rhizoclosmatium globosum]